MSSPAALPRSMRAVLVAFALVVLVFTKDRPDSWADGSRLATIQALVEDGTLAIDGTDYFWQGDKVRVGERYYSHQPPMLALLGAVPYAVLHHGLGRAIDAPHTYRVITWLVVGLPLLAGLWALARLLVRVGCGGAWGAFWLACAAFGTLALPYALVLNQHAPAAGLTMLALHAAVSDRAWRAGLAAALAATIDLTAVFCAAAVAWPAFRAGGARAALRYGLGALVPLALHLGVNVGLVGDVRPLGMHADAFRYPLSPFLVMSLTGVESEGRAGEQALYAWRALFGQSGLFSNHPILLLCVVAGLALPLRRRRPVAKARTAEPPGLLAAVAGLSLAIAAYYVTQSRNFGGSAFGMRWFTVFAPLLVLFGAAWIGRAERAPRPGPAALVGLAVLALWSGATAALASVQPWTKIAWTWSQTPAAPLARPGDPVPGHSEHLRGELRRIRAFEQSFDRAAYERFFVELVTRCGLVHAKRWPGLGEDEQRAFTREGIAILAELAAVNEGAPGTQLVRARTHFWLGKLHKQIGNDDAARAELARSLDIDPDFAPAREALRSL